MLRRWIRLLVALYPPEFRDGYGDGLVETFEAQWADTASALDRGMLLGRTSWKLAAGAVAEWRDTDSRDEGGETMGRWMTELRLAMRRLARAPGFAAVAVGTIGIASGAFGAVFAVVSDVLMEEMPFEDPDELVWVWRDYWGDFPRGWVSGYDIDLMREHDVFEGVVGVRTGRVNLTDASGTGARDVRTLLGSPGYLDLLGVRPMIGPGFSEASETGTFADRHPEVVLRHGLWVSAFAADPTIVGRDIYLDGDPYTVVGVMEPEFDLRQGSSLGTATGADAYLTLLVDLSQEDVYSGSFAALARIRGDAPPGAAEAALAAVSAEIDPHFNDRGMRLWTVDVREDLIGDVRRPLLAVLGAGGFLLLILGANLATLMLARSSEQAGGAAVRAALGATRSSRLRTALAEPFVVAAGGVLLGGAIAWFGTGALRSAVADTVPRAAEIGFEPDTALAVLLGVAVIVALGALGPAVRWISIRPLAGMAEGGRGGHSIRSERARAALVVAQVGMALTLVIGAGLLFRTVQGLVRQDPGFDVGEALTFRVGLQGPSYTDGPAIVDAQTGILEGLRGLPGVETAGYTNALPLSETTNQFSIGFPDFPAPEDERSQLVDAFVVSSGYAEALGMRLVQGRTFRETDAVTGEEGLEVEGVLIDDVLAARWFPDGNAVGGRVTLFSNTTLPVLGVVDQPRLYSVAEDDRGQLYLPAPMRVRSETRYVLRAHPGVDANTLLSDVRRIVEERDGGLAVSEVRTLDGIVQASVGGQRLNLRLASVFALAALILSGLGLYGVVSGTVVRRRREIGLRMAMGAEPTRVVQSVLGQGLRLVVIGAVIGVGISWAVGRWIASFLFGVDPLDPVTMAMAAGILLATALLAAWLPARRATRIPPAEALRAE